MNIGGYELVQTCVACPEQYDVFNGERLVGYFRLRHGVFDACYLGVLGKIVYSAETIGDGVFAVHERDWHLTKAIDPDGKLPRVDITLDTSGLRI